MPFYHPAKLTALGKSWILIFPLSNDKKRKLDFQMPAAGAKQQAGPSDLRGSWPASAPDTWKKAEARCYALPFPPARE